MPEKKRKTFEEFLATATPEQLKDAYYRLGEQRRALWARVAVLQEEARR